MYSYVIIMPYLIYIFRYWSAVPCCHSYVSDGFLSPYACNDSFFPTWFLDYWSFSLEVIWGQSPLKSRLNIFEDPIVAASS